jgi:hypothetical protein
MNISVGQQFKIRETGEVIRVIEIKEKNEKRVKLKDPIYVMAYYSAKPQFTLYQNDVKRLIDFNSWIKTRI